MVTTAPTISALFTLFKEPHFQHPLHRAWTLLEIPVVLFALTWAVSAHHFKQCSGGRGGIRTRDFRIMRPVRTARLLYPAMIYCTLFIRLKSVKDQKKHDFCTERPSAVSRPNYENCQFSTDQKILSLKISWGGLMWPRGRCRLSANRIHSWAGNASQILLFLFERLDLTVPHRRI